MRKNNPTIINTHSMYVAMRNLIKEKNYHLSFEDRIKTRTDNILSLLKKYGYFIPGFTPSYIRLNGKMIVVVEGTLHGIPKEIHVIHKLLEDEYFKHKPPITKRNDKGYPI